MTDAGRAARRVLFMRAVQPDGTSTEIGGLSNVDGITSGDLLCMVRILLPRASPDTTIQDPTGTTLVDDAQPLKQGHYTIFGSRLEVSCATYYTRAYSTDTGPRVEAFTRAIRDRDQRCVITKSVNHHPEDELSWWRFEAAHIIPLAYAEQVPSTAGSINSVQNGLLLRRDLHTAFDQYLWSINPYVVAFSDDLGDIAHLTLDRQLLDDDRRPPDVLLHWHFQQAVLANMRGAGEPVFEHDYPPGSDNMGQIMDGPQASQRLEFEFFNRLKAHVDFEGQASRADEVKERGKGTRQMNEANERGK